MSSSRASPHPGALGDRPRPRAARAGRAAGPVRRGRCAAAGARQPVRSAAPAGRRGRASSRAPASTASSIANRPRLAAQVADVDGPRAPGRAGAPRREHASVGDVAQHQPVAGRSGGTCSSATDARSARARPAVAPATGPAARRPAGAAADGRAAARRSPRGRRPPADGAAAAATTRASRRVGVEGDQHRAAGRHGSFSARERTCRQAAAGRCGRGCRRARPRASPRPSTSTLSPARAGRPRPAVQPGVGDVVPGGDDADARASTCTVRGPRG